MILPQAVRSGLSREHPLWWLLLSFVFAAALTWAVRPPLVQPPPIQHTAQIIAVHSHFGNDAELSDRVPSELGQVTPLPISQGWQKRNLWVHLRVQASGPLWLEMTPPRLTLARLHHQGRDGQWRSQDNGATIPVAQREVRVPLIVFALDFPPEPAQHDVWVEVRSRSPLSLSFVLHQPEAFLPILTDGLIPDILALGALMVLGVMAFGVGVIARDVTLWLLSCRAALAGVWTLQQTGLLAQVLPSAWVGPLATEILIVGQLTLMAQLATSWAYLRGCALPRWGDGVFALFMLVLSIILGLDVLNVVEHPFVSITIVLINVLGLAVSLGMSAWLVWRRQYMATVIVVTSVVAMFFYYPVVVRLLGLTGQAVLVQRVFSPLPTVVILVLLFAGAVIQLQRSQRAAQRAALATQAEQIVWLEQRVAERTTELETAKNVAEQLNAAKSVFLAKVSHELRAPMHTILGYVDLALRENLSMRLRQLLQVVQGAGRQLQTQIEDLLDFARLERSQLRLQPTVVSVSELHQTVVELAWLQASDSGNMFQHHCDAALNTVCIHADARRIEQVLMILLTNACRYTQNGFVWLHTECVEASDAERVRLRFSVKDTGRGIRPAVLAQIFQAFERGDTIDGDGLGLGLSIAQPLLALMHSELEVESTVGVGSRFSFVLELPRASTVESSSHLSPAMAVPSPTPMTMQEQDWQQLMEIAQHADLSALDTWQRRFPQLPPDLQGLVWGLNFEGIQDFAAKQLMPPPAERK